MVHLPQMATELIHTGRVLHPRDICPSRVPVHVDVVGRTSKAIHVTVVEWGRLPPPGLVGGPFEAYEGFSWFLSYHYALQTDFGCSKATHFLHLLEMAFPHYRHLYGDEDVPSAGRYRMVVAYASTAEKLRELTRVHKVEWDPATGGGVTLLNKCAYCYPSGSLEYHLRYILLHEAAHLYQLVLCGSINVTPKGLLEGVADFVGHHNFDPSGPFLTVGVLDRAPLLNYFEEGLVRILYERQDLTLRQIIHNQNDARRPDHFLWVHYMFADSKRWEHLQNCQSVLIHENQTGRAMSARADELFCERFGSLEEQDVCFRIWVRERRPTFHQAAWGWEQEGATLWSYGFNEAPAQMDTNCTPQDVGVIPPTWKMDYPPPLPSPLVDEPHVGPEGIHISCLVDFSKNPCKGMCGLALGRCGGVGNWTRVVISMEQSCGPVLVLAEQVFQLPSELQRAAGCSGGNQYGLSICLSETDSTLSTTVRAGVPPCASFDASVTLPCPVLRRALTTGVSILANGGYHGVTPFLVSRKALPPF